MSGHKGDLLVDLLVELERRMLLLQEDSNVLFATLMSFTGQLFLQVSDSSFVFDSRWMFLTLPCNGCRGISHFRRVFDTAQSGTPSMVAKKRHVVEFISIRFRPTLA